jgi:hypothetical protein
VADWPGDIALTLNWLPTTDLRVSEIGDEFCSHALIDSADGSRVRVIEASKDWPVEQVRAGRREVRGRRARRPDRNSTDTFLPRPLSLSDFGIYF